MVILMIGYCLMGLIFLIILPMMPLQIEIEYILEDLFRVY